MEIDISICESELGSVLVALEPEGVAAVLLADTAALAEVEFQSRYLPEKREMKREISRGSDEGCRIAEHVTALIANPLHPPLAELPLATRGTSFQRLVWDELRKIPAGETLSYGALAARIGVPGAVRAVASACGANAHAIIIPCHRVVRKDGELAGYRWGVHRKRELLKKESRFTARSPRGV